jgi:SAM-dependent methyltransferase
MLAETRGAAESVDLVYKFKAGPYSSHAILMATLPRNGAGKSLLDVGCGDGYLSKILSERGYHVTGLEQRGGYSDRFPASVRLIEADLERGLPPLPETYDYVMCADILEHLRRPEDLLVQLRRVLKPGGVLIASLPNSGNFYFRLNVLFGRFPHAKEGLFDRTHVRFYMWDGWRALLEGAGFRITSVRSTSIPFERVAGNSAPVYAMEKVYYQVARLWKALLAYQFVLTAVRAED